MPSLFKVLFKEHGFFSFQIQKVEFFKHPILYLPNPAPFMVGPEATNVKKFLLCICRVIYVIVVHVYLKTYITCFFLSILTCFWFLGSTGDSILGHSTTKLCYILFQKHGLAKWPRLASCLSLPSHWNCRHNHHVFWDVFTRKCAALTPSFNLHAAFHHVITLQGPWLLESSQALLLRTSLCLCLWSCGPSSVEFLHS